MFKSTLSVAIFAASMASATAGTFIYRKPIAGGTKCPAPSACALPTAGPQAPTVPTPAEDPTPTPDEGTQVNGTLVATQALAVARASAYCFHAGNIVSSATALAVRSASGVLCLSSPPSTAAGGSWAIQQNFASRTYTAAFKVRSVDAQTGQVRWDTVMVAGAPTSATYRSYVAQVVASRGASVYLDGGEYAAFNYSAVLSGVSAEYCEAVSASSTAGVSCAGGTVTALFPAPAFSNVGAVSSPSSVAKMPSWANSTVAYPAP